MEEQIYPPLMEEIQKLIKIYYSDFIIKDDLDYDTDELSDDDEIDYYKMGKEKYLQVCQQFYNGSPPEFLSSPYEYKIIEGWGLTYNRTFSFEIILAYFREDDWERVFIKNNNKDDLGRVESRNDLWEKWKHTFSTYEFRKDFVYGYFFPEETIKKSSSNKTKRDSISVEVQREVWKRDGGVCIICGSQEKLEYDHIIPVSKGGSSTARNIQLLCEKHNRQKSNNI
jgi:hypothetical protein